LAAADFDFEREPLRHEAAFSVSAVRFPSPIASPDPENNVVHAEYFAPARVGRRPAVVVLHILGADFALSRYLCARLAGRGVAAAVDPAIHQAALILAGGDLARILWEMPESARYRQLWVESGRTLADLRALTDPFDPLTYGDRLVGKRVLMIAGMVDEVIPPA